MRSYLQSALVFSLLVAVPGISIAQESSDCRQVHIGDGGWTDNLAQDGFAAVVLKGLGYEPTVTVLAIGVMYEGMKRGDIDVSQGQWAPNGDAIVQPYIDAGIVRKIGTNLTGAKYALAVPSYTYDQGLKTIQDIAKWKDRLHGKIYALEPGNDSNLLLEKMQEERAAGLEEFQIVESSEQAMLSAVDKAIHENEPIVFIGWAPHPMNVKFDMKYLGGGDEWFGPNYGSATIWTGMRPAYADACPNVTRFFEKLVFTPELLGEAMARISDEGATGEQVAEDYVKANPRILKGWLDGVSSADGGDGLAAVEKYLGLPPDAQ